MSLAENSNLASSSLKQKDLKSFFFNANRKRKAVSVVSDNQGKLPKLGDNATISDSKTKSPILDLRPNEGVELLETEPDIAANNDSAVESAASVLNGKDHNDSDTAVIVVKGSSCDDVSLKSSSDEMDSSNLNISVNTSEQSECIENATHLTGDSSFNADSKPDTIAKKSNDKVEGQNEPPKKRKRMSLEEAKQRSEEREKKQKEHLLKKQEMETLKHQKQMEKEQRLKQKEQEKKEKEFERKEKERLRQEKERLRQEKKEQEELEKQQRLKEKEEKKKSQLMILEMKIEEKKRKEEMKLKKEEEMKKLEEEKQKAKILKEQKEKEKLEKNKAAFLKFFKKGASSTVALAGVQVPEKETYFKPFQILDDMTLAPVVRKAALERFNKEKLDSALKSQGNDELYLQILKTDTYKDIRFRKRQKKKHECDVDVIEVDKKAVPELFMSAKLLQFSENIRPPYWGTWQKQSKNVHGRNPFGQDAIFDYDVDSDEEWDEGGPGESLSGTDNEVESEDDYEVDNEFFVPHGYLSAEEEDEDEEAVNDPEKQKALLKIKLQEFEKERRKKTTELKPIILGCYFESLSKCKDNSMVTLFEPNRAEMISDTPIPTRFTIKKLQAETNSPTTCSSAKKSGLQNVTEEAMPHLIRMLHGNVNNRDALVKEFQAFWQQHCRTKSPPKTVNQDVELSVENNSPCVNSNPETLSSELVSISKRQLLKTMKVIAVYGKHPAVKKLCWLVLDEIREKYNLLDAPIPNEWIYVLKTNPEESPISKPTPATTSIKEFLLP